MTPSPAARRVAVALAAACVLLPLAAWLPGQPRPDLQQGGWMTLAAVSFVAWTALARRRVPLVPGSALVAAALLLSLVPWLGQPWLQLRGALADRAPLAAGWLLLGAARAWPGLAAPLVRTLGVATAALLLLGLAQATGLWQGDGGHAPFADPDGQAALLLVVALAACTTPGVAGRLPLALLVASLAWCGWLGLAAARLGAMAGLMTGWRRGRLSGPMTSLAAAALLAGELLRLAAPAPAQPHDASAAVRAAVHGAALPRALDAPQGIGLGRWGLDYAVWRPLAEAEAAVTAGVASAPPPSGPRDEVLLTLLEAGWGGALLLGAAAWLLLRRVARPNSSATDDPLPVLATLAGLALLSTPLSGAPPVLAAAALLVGALRPESERAVRTTGSHRATTALTLGLAVLVALPAAAQVRGERAMAAALAADSADPEARLAEAAEARPWDPQPWFLLAGIARQLEAWPEARTLFQRALDAAPTHLGALTGAWLVEMLAPDGDAAHGFRLLERAERLAPWHPAVRGARPAWLRAVRARHLEKARAMLAQGSGYARTLTCSAYLCDARVALLEGDAAAARAALEQAAPLVDGSARLRIERLTRAESLDESTVAALMLRLWPSWPEI